MNENPGIVCVDCGKTAPGTETPYTLIGRRHRWRLTFAVDAQGKRLPEWRCAKCAERVKLAQREALGAR
jgi:DNA-directed RNA polymerase subunit RPC12/RpoP